MSSIGLKLLSSVVGTGSIQEFIGLGLEERLFRGSEVEVFQFLNKHVMSFGVIPSVDTVLEKIGGHALVDAPEPPEFYLVEAEKRYIQSTLKKMITDTQECLVKQDPEAAFMKALEVISDLHLQKHRRHIIDFRDAADVVKAEYIKQKQMDETYSTLLGWPTLDNMVGGLRGGDMLSIVGRPASGKAQPLTSKILLSSGWTTMGSLKVGDTLASVDGLPSEVTAIFPQGSKPVVAFNFIDGRRVECCTEHLWEVYSRHWPEKYRVMQAWEVRNLLKAKRHQGRLSVRLFSGQFGVDSTFSIPPYLLGSLLGDGCFRGSSPSFSTADSESLSRLNGILLPGYEFVHAAAYDYRLVCTNPGMYASSSNGKPENQYKLRLKSLGLWGCMSQDKFIPQEYLSGSFESRLALLQGLMDTDGTTSKLGGVSFSTSSRVLADQVLQLVWGLGGACSGVKTKKTSGLDNFILHIRFNNPQQSFSLTRKKERLPTSNQFTGCLRAVIESVEPIGMKECQCITVSHPSKLYVTDDFVVTHNTFLGLYSAEQSWVHGGVPLFLSMEMTNTLIAQRLAAMNTHKPLTQLLKGMMSSSAWKSFQTSLHGLKKKEKPFWLVDGNLATSVDELVSLARQFKPSAVYVDGAYLLSHPDRRISRFEKITENAEALKKRVATELDVPVIASYQFSREAEKKKKSHSKHKEEVGLEDIYGSDAIGQLSSVVLGLFEEESIETLVRRRVEVLKGRHGETGSFLINWNFLQMDFSEIPSKKGSDGKLQEDTSDLQFLW